MSHRGNNNRRGRLGPSTGNGRFKGMQGARVADFERYPAPLGDRESRSRNPSSDRVVPEVLDRAGVTGGVPGLLKMLGLDERGIPEAPAPGELPPGPVDPYSAAYWGLEDSGGK